MKDIDKKNHTQCFFNDIVNIKYFDPDNIKRDEKSHENILIDIYLIFSKVNGYFEGINKIKYLALVIIVRAKKK